MTGGSQKFIARNRAPRVQIEYDVELYGSQKTVQLPFVMGVMSDLAGKSKAAQPSIDDRKFLEIDVDNFDDRMKAMQPRTAFSVPNTLTGEGNLTVDLTFEKMSDFSPEAIAAKIEPLRALLEARTQLSNLMTYMDGKTGAEALIEKILADRGLLSAISGAAATSDQTDAALDSLRVLAVEQVEERDSTVDVLDNLKTDALPDEPEQDVASEVLSALARTDQPDTEPMDASADVLQGLRELKPEDEAKENSAQNALDALRTSAPAHDAPDTSVDDTLAGLARSAPEVASQPDTTEAALDSLAQSEVSEVKDNATDEVLADLASAALEETPQHDSTSDVLDNLIRSETSEPMADATERALAELAVVAPEDDQTQSDLDVALDSLDGVEIAEDSVGDFLGDLGPENDTDGAALADDLDDFSGDVEPEGKVIATASTDDLDDLLDDLVPEEDTEAATSADDLDNLLDDAEPEGEVIATASTDDLDDLLDDLVPEEDSEAATSADDLDDLLGDFGPKVDVSATYAEDAEPTDAAPQIPNAVSASRIDSEFSFGMMAVDRPDAERMNRKRFRVALMGDFSGRAARGAIETGDALATRKAILLDPDTVEDVISGFSVTLVLPIGKDGAGVEVKLGGLDDLHPDELYENVEIFSELAGLRAQLGSGVTVDNAMQKLREWGDAYDTPVAPTFSKSRGNAVPADLRLTDFQKLIGDSAASLTRPSPVEELLARVVGPHIRAVPDADAVAMQAAVDAALSGAMRLVLHHPEFQSVEAQWRSIDLIARSIETDDTLEVMLYDISAEEIAADLSAADDLSQSGFARLLTDDPLDAETGRGGYSALIGLYTFEETPPHAELLGRIARVSAHVDAPFLAAISPAFLAVAKEDRHPLVSSAWDTLRAMPEAGYVGLASPRFMLRRPYGAKSEPIYEFEFEEFTMSAGLNGMLWANPVVLVAILLAKSYRQNGAAMGLGSVMSLGEIPYHFVTDQHGDQVALPCTERNLTLDKVEKVMARGVMPVVSIKGRDEIRLASFQSLAGGDILGPWSDVPPPPPSPPKPEPVWPSEPAKDGADDLGLDDLLAGFQDDGPPAESDDIDADLAALLEDL